MKWNHVPEFIHVFFYISIFSSYQNLNAFLALGPVDTMHSCFSLDFLDESLKTQIHEESII